MSKMRSCTKAGFFLAGCIVSTIGFAGQPGTLTRLQQMQQLKDAHVSVIDRMNAPGPDGRLPQLEDERISPSLKEGWQLAGAWAADWLEMHPGASGRTRSKLFAQFSPPSGNAGVYDLKTPDRYALDGFATPIGKDVYVVAANYSETQGACGAGTFMVVARDAAGILRPLWSIKPIAEQHFEVRDEIGHWAYLGCGAYYNGPLIASKVITLPAADNGQLRFAVNAYQATNGSTLLQNLTIWQWNGREAVNLVAGAYQDYIDDNRVPVLQNGMLTLPTTEVTSSFQSFGAAEEPRGEWRIRLSPDSAKDLGHRFLNPGVAWLDAFLSAMATGHDASGLASTAAINQVKLEWQQENSENGANAEKQPADSSSQKDPEEEPAFNLGFLYQFRATGPGAFTVKCDEALIRATYRMRAGKPYFTSVRFLAPN